MSIDMLFGLTISKAECIIGTEKHPDDSIKIENKPEKVMEDCIML